MTEKPVGENGIADNGAVGTHCPYCALQCGMNLVGAEPQEGAEPGAGPATITLHVEPRDFVTNRGGLCRKGWTAAELLDHPERLRTPLLRAAKGEPLLPVSWDAALDHIAQRMQAVAARRGHDAVAVFGGGGLTNEKAYALGKFARVALQTANIDYNGRFCMSSAAAAAVRAFGIDRGLPFPLQDIAAADAILLAGSNLAETMPPVMAYFDEQRRRGGRLIVVDPRRTPTAAAAAMHLQIAPGTDLALANGLLHLALRDGLVDEAYIDTRTEGFAAVRQSVAAYWPERVERICGVPVAEMTLAVHWLAQARRALVLSARGTEQHSSGTENVLALINLTLALGKAGVAGSGYGCLTGQGNGQGGREHGQKCDQLPGYRSIENPAHRAHIARIWGIEESSLPRAGRAAYELLTALGTTEGPAALLVMGSNPAVSAPNAAAIRQRLQSLELLVVADIFVSETALLADVVLPVTQWAEEEGTVTNLEGRVLRRRAARPAPAGVRSDLAIIASLAQRLGCGEKFSADPRRVFTELARASAGGAADYSGITYQRIEEEEGVFWPCPGAAHPGTPRMFLQGFGTPTGRARFCAVAQREGAEVPCEAYPLWLSTGRVLAQYQSGTQTRRVASLNEAQPCAFAEMHPSLAAAHDLAEGEMVRVASRRGAIKVAARLTTTLRADSLFVPFHWGGDDCANLLTHDALDPHSKMPAFKLCAARLEKLAPLPDQAPATVNGGL